MLDPREAGKKPPFSERSQNRAPGVEGQMKTSPDYGESSYVGHDRLAGRVALVTGGRVLA